MSDSLPPVPGALPPDELPGRNLTMQTPPSTATQDISLPSSDSSPLSSPCSSPPLRMTFEALPSPSPSSQDSGSAHDSSSASLSPVPELDSPDSSSLSLAAVDGAADGRPPKRRRTAEPKPRTTTHIDLRPGAPQLDDAQEAGMQRLMKSLRNKKKIVVIAGAGISVSAGIPDFRSSQGLFNSLKKEHKLKASGKQLFDASVYRDDTSTSNFHDMVRRLHEVTRDSEATPFHHLLATLSKQGRLLRLYSQNVDGIEDQLEPLKTQIPLPKKGPWPKTIQLHGGLSKQICSKCHECSDFEPELFRGPTPAPCPSCLQWEEARESAGRRSHGVGCLRPRMVLYNEHNPDEDAIGSVTSADFRSRPDAVIVCGTTLKVPGVRRIAREMCKIVRDRRDGLAVWLNNDPEPPGVDMKDCWDLVVRGACDDIANRVALGRFDEVEYRKLSDEEHAKAKLESEVPVVLQQTPNKAPVQQTRTPSDTPKPSTLQAEAVCPAGAPIPLKLPNPASKGMPLTQLLDGKPVPKKRGRKPAVKSSKIAKTTKAAKATAAETSQPKMTSTFKGSKKTTTEQSKPAAVVSDKPPRKRAKKTSTPEAMQPISPQAARNNASPVIEAVTPPHTATAFKVEMTAEDQRVRECSAENVAIIKNATISPKEVPRDMRERRIID